MAQAVVDESNSNAKTNSTVAAAAEHESIDGGESSDGSADKERLAVPSIGSRLHGTGECKPCAWFWKPQGCQNDKDCLHCHLCPRNAIKDRKKLHAAVRKEIAQVPQQVEPSGILEAESKAEKDGTEIEEGAQFVDTSELRLRGKPSKGSLLHGTGECKPCAWFWHPKGCENDEECEFCHFCPLGELKVRRKQRVQQLRGGYDESVDSPKYVSLPAALPADGSGKPSDTSTQVLNDARPTAQAQVSVGSAPHGTGECKPCAWFWKPGGCQNGKECLHCHLCPDGELRRKKKEKTVTIGVKKKNPGPAHLSVRQQLAFQNQIIQQQQQHLAQLQAQMLVQQQMMWAAGAMGNSMGVEFGQYNNIDQDDADEESFEAAS
eukprot:TRINITY_DN1025_c0_g1_i1.p1 TRINITY_DN1025_c0_g1~~TRINITY_DN1025_c0_g1_i1.p1  ORF type:complete len:399 (-),score=86.32 TRINITY_DN1025_c0_g1_i1:143-1273(-)